MTKIKNEIRLKIWVYKFEIAEMFNLRSELTGHSRFKMSENEFSLEMKKVKKDEDHPFPYVLLISDDRRLAETAADIVGELPTIQRMREGSRLEVPVFWQSSKVADRSFIDWALWQSVLREQVMPLLSMT